MFDKTQMSINYLNHPESRSGQVMTNKKQKYLHMKLLYIIKSKSIKHIRTCVSI